MSHEYLGREDYIEISTSDGLFIWVGRIRFTGMGGGNGGLRLEMVYNDVESGCGAARILRWFVFRFI